jgi:hypothetical protein
MMRSVKTGVVFAAAVLAAGCTLTQPPTRGQAGVQALLPAQAQGYAVQRVNVLVPRSLTVSEANTIKPSADIVWHGEAAGDRHAQVERIVRDAITRGSSAYAKGTPVVLDVQVLRFHALTPRTRQSIGGKHELIYALNIRDAATGAVLAHVPRVNASVRGSGGAQAAAEEAVGRTEAVVIREALAASIVQTLEPQRSRAGGVAGGLLGGLVAQGRANPALAVLD